MTAQSTQPFPLLLLPPQTICTFPDYFDLTTAHTSLGLQELMQESATEEPTDMQLQVFHHKTSR